MSIILGGPNNYHVLGEPDCHIRFKVFVVQAIEPQISIHQWERLILTGIKHFYFIDWFVHIVYIAEVSTKFLMRLCQFLAYPSIAVGNDAPTVGLLFLSLKFALGLDCNNLGLFLHVYLVEQKIVPWLLQCKTTNKFLNFMIVVFGEI